MRLLQNHDNYDFKLPRNGNLLKCVFTAPQNVDTRYTMINALLDNRNKHSDFLDNLPLSRACISNSLF